MSKVFGKILKHALNEQNTKLFFGKFTSSFEKIFFDIFFWNH